MWGIEEENTNTTTIIVALREHITAFYRLIFIIIILLILIGFGVVAIVISDVQTNACPTAKSEYIFIQIIGIEMIVFCVIVGLFVF